MLAGCKPVLVIKRGWGLRKVASQPITHILLLSCLLCLYTVGEWRLGVLLSKVRTIYLFLIKFWTNRRTLELLCCWCSTNFLKYFSHLFILNKVESNYGTAAVISSIFFMPPFPKTYSFVPLLFFFICHLILYISKFF